MTNLGELFILTHCCKRVSPNFELFTFHNSLLVNFQEGYLDVLPGIGHPQLIPELMLFMVSRLGKLGVDGCGVCVEGLYCVISYNIWSLNVI